MSRPHVLVISTALDHATDRVIEALHELGAVITRLNTEDLPFSARLSLQTGETTRAALRINAEPGQFTACFYRRVRVPPQPPDMDAGVYEFALRETRAALVGSLLGLELIRFLNDPVKTWAAEFKPYQLQVAQAAGLRIPPTLISNDPAEVRAAFERFTGAMVAKAVRIGYAEPGGQPHAIYTSRVEEDHLRHDRDIELAPVIYQRLIPKRCDVRVTIVGEQLFAAEIHSQDDPAARIDWRRTANPELPHSPVALPVELQAKLLRLMAHLGLVYGAVDLAHTPSGEYVFLEVNPSGQWLWLEDQLSFPITLAVSRWLAGLTGPATAN